MSSAISGLSLFAPASGRPFGERVARSLGVTLAPLEERDFEDGEHKSRPLASVRGHDVYVIESLCSDLARGVNDKLVRLLFLLGALKDAGAARVTAVVPYLCYARKDRRTKPRDPVTTRYVAALFEAVGLDRMVTVDVHNLAAYQNAFRIAAEHLEARRLFVAHASILCGRIAVVSPDVGGVKRAEAFREALEQRLGCAVAAGFMEKHRSAGKVSGEALVGDVEGHTVLLLDDMIASGTTLARTAMACQAGGAKKVIGMATHGAFTAGAAAVLAHPALDELVITDTIPPQRLSAPDVQRKLSVLDTSGFIAEAIRRLHEHGSLVELVQDDL
jgi:ribose-phosphate pyrophosphokinase